MTPHQHIDLLYSTVRDLPEDDPAWAGFRAEQDALMPVCANHPTRAGYSALSNGPWLCADCVVAALPAWRALLREM